MFLRVCDRGVSCPFARGIFRLRGPCNLVSFGIASMYSEDGDCWLSDSMRAEHRLELPQHGCSRSCSYVRRTRKYDPRYRRRTDPVMSEQECLGAKLYYCHFPEPRVRNDMQWRTTVLCPGIILVPCSHAASCILYVVRKAEHRSCRYHGLYATFDTMFCLRP